jgi:hypothetical protein
LNYPKWTDARTRTKLLTKTQTVVFYGSSLALASMGAVLGEREELRVEYIEARRPEDALQLKALHPDVVLFDLATTQPEFILSLFQARPTVRLIAVDLAGGRLLALSGRELRGLAAPDLLQAILGTPRSSGGA